MSCPDDLQTAFLEGDFIESIQCVYTTGDPVLDTVVPSIIYGVIIMALFVRSRSIILPSVIGIIFAGVMLVVLPGSAIVPVVIFVTLFVAIGGYTLTQRMSFS